MLSGGSLEPYGNVRPRPVSYTHLDVYKRQEYRELIVRGEKKEQAVCDYLSGMTDQYSIRKFREIYIPKAWEVY